MQKFLVEFCASFLLWFLFLGLGILWVIDGKIKKEQVLHALFACFTAWFVAFLIKQLFPTLRPYVYNGREIGVLIRPNDGAFPSEHTALSFALSVTIFMHDRKIGWLFLALSLLVGSARVLANVHYPVDILGGAFIGTLIAVIVEKIHLAKFLSSKRLGKS